MSINLQRHIEQDDHASNKTRNRIMITLQPTIIPYVYLYNGNLVIRRTYNLEEEVVISMIILYRLDWMVFRIIKKRYYASDQNVKQVNNIATAIIDEMDKIFRD